jgi:acyl carrier protein
MEDGVLEDLLVFICRNFMVDRNDVPLDESLIDTGIIDSVGLIEISTFIQKQFGIPVKEEHLNRANFGSVLKLVDFIKRQKNT